MHTETDEEIRTGTYSRERVDEERERILNILRQEVDACLEVISRRVRSPEWAEEFNKAISHGIKGIFE